MKLPFAAVVLLVSVTGGPTPAAADTSRDAQRCLAQTIYWEARAEGAKGTTAVGWVVLNRMRNEEFPKTVCAVVRQGGPGPACQFSYWCDGRRDLPKRGEQWTEAQQIARRLLANPPPDPTKGALYYHAANQPPPWKIPRTRIARIGQHVYYR